MPDITTRRVVTGHDPDGRAVFERDENLTSLDPRNGQPQSGKTYGIATICKTEGVPPRVNEPFIDWHGKPIGITDPNGVICRVIHFPPAGVEDDDLNIVHRTQSVDFGIVLDGQIELHLDDGHQKTIGKGTVVVQRGTTHQWINTSRDYCVMAFILMPSDKPQVEKTGDTLEPTEFPSY